MISEKIIDKAFEKNNHSVVGLDTRFEYLPERFRTVYIERYGETLKAASEALLRFNRDIIDAVYDIVPAVKIQIACYEMYGPEGIGVFADTCAYAKTKGLYVIADCKRNDIGSTAAAYSNAYLGMTEVGKSSIRAYETDMLTVNPYLGTDGLKPFFEDCSKYDKGVFILVKTSNPSSAQFQDLVFKNSEKTLYRQVADMVNESITETDKYGYSRIGAVVGATYPEIAKELRSVLDKSILLVPGYGAQGAGGDHMRNFFDSNGTGALVNSSRAILMAYREAGTDDYAAAARDKVIRMRDDINSNI